MFSLTKELKKFKELGISVHVSKPLKENQRNKRDIAQGAVDTLKPEVDGFLLNSTDRQLSFALIVVRTDNANDVRVVTVEPGFGRRITALGNQGPDGSAPVNVRMVTTHTNYQDLATTYPQDNNVRVITTRDNIFRMFQVGIVTRINEQEQSEYFLTVQEMYRSELVLEGNLITAPDYPGYTDWQDLQVLVGEMVDQSSLPIKKQVSKKKPTPRLKANEGRVIYFNVVDGVGKVNTNDGVQHLHWSQINTPDRIDYLTNGQKVTFASILNTAGKGTQLIGVKPA